MLNYSKITKIKNVCERFVTIENLIASIFEDNPELVTFSYSCTNEYDDNNYSDYTRLVSINGHSVDYDGEYEEDYADEENVESTLAKITDKELIWGLQDLVNSIGTHFDRGEDIELSRDNYAMKKRRRLGKDEKAELDYVISYLSGNDLPDEWFLNNDPEYASYYAQDHGRFSKEMETKLFANKGCMRAVYMYAQAIGKPVLEEIETFFVTHNIVGSENEEDNKYLKKYLALKDTLKKKKCAK
jgi:hypothetical protein